MMLLKSQQGRPVALRGFAQGQWGVFNRGCCGRVKLQHRKHKVSEPRKLIEFLQAFYKAILFVWQWFPECSDVAVVLLLPLQQLAPFGFAVSHPHWVVVGAWLGEGGKHEGCLGTGMLLFLLHLAQSVTASAMFRFLSLLLVVGTRYFSHSEITNLDKCITVANTTSICSGSK